MYNLRQGMVFRYLNNKTFMELKNAFQHKNEWNQLIQAIDKIDSFIEIGTCNGGTFKYLAEIAQGIKISIDLATGDFGGIGEAKAIERNNRINSKYDNCHFINRDSKDFETVKQIEKLLNGKQVDFLFIDGDHTFEGVQADFMIYRQFVKQGGFIALHDIIESKFHTAAKCFVSKFWAKLKHTGHEFVSKDNNDVTDNASGIGNNKFGGIGLIKNDFKESKIHIFKPIHSQESLDLCLKNCGDNIPTLVYNEDTIFFENAVIRKVYETYSFDSKDYIGITSPIMELKTYTTLDNIIYKCQSVDVLNYGNLKMIAGNNLDVWRENGNGRKGTNLYMAAVELNDAKILPFDIFDKKWTCLYCNYFICRVSIFNEYVKTVLITAMDWLSKSKWTVWNDKKLGLLHRQKYYPISVFICECMFGTFLSHNNFKIKDLRMELTSKTLR